MVIHLIIFSLLFIAGVSKAVMDKINFHFENSIFVKLNGLFWNPVYSWTNKYKGGIYTWGPRFWGSTTFFVSFTDAWHLFQMVYGFTFASGFVLLGMFSTWWIAVIGYVFHRIVFEIFFDKIFTFKN